MFRGRFEHTLDDKGRLAVPARFRDILLGQNDSATLIITKFENCLAAYTMAEWELLEQKIMKLPQFDAKVAAFKRVFIGCAQECPLDRSGRILVPAELRRDADIGQDCIIIGQISKFEIWSKQRWDAIFSEASDQFQQLSSSLAAHGIVL